MLIWCVFALIMNLKSGFWFSHAPTFRMFWICTFVLCTKPNPSSHFNLTFNFFRAILYVYYGVYNSIHPPPHGGRLILDKLRGGHRIMYKYYIPFFLITKANSTCAWQWFQFRKSYLSFYFTFQTNLTKEDSQNSKF